MDHGRGIRSAAVITRRALLAGVGGTAATRAQEEPVYDLILKNGHVLDPANHRSSRLDIGITGGRIVRVGTELRPAHARQTVPVDGCYVVPGLIDIHTHVDVGGA